MGGWNKVVDLKMGDDRGYGEMGIGRCMF